MSSYLGYYGKSNMNLSFLSFVLVNYGKLHYFVAYVASGSLLEAAPLLSIGRVWYCKPPHLPE